MKEKIGGFILIAYLCTQKIKINPEPPSWIGGGRIKQAIFG